jgi:hypothetical protein
VTCTAARGNRDDHEAEAAMSRIQRQRTKGWRMPEGAIYVGRPSVWGNPWPIDGDMQPWLALALGLNGNEAGRRESAVLAYRAWMAGQRLPIPAADGPGTGEGGDLEYSDGTIRHVSDIVVAMGVLMLGRATISVPVPPDLEPLRGHDLACWCPLDAPCHADVILDLLA